MVQPLVSIIIPTYNRAHLITETLDSILVQTYKNWECIIVDDGSTDNTEEIVQTYLENDSRFQYHHRPEDRLKGANACRNYGFELSRGEYIQWFDSDDLMERNALSFTTTIFMKQPELDYLIGTTGKIHNEQIIEEIINRDPDPIKEESYLSMFLQYRLPWPILSGVWKRRVIYKFPFDENLLRLQDVDFHLRILLSNKYQGKRIFKIINYYRINTENRVTNLDFLDKVISSFMLFHKKILTYDLKENKKFFKKFIFFFLFRFLYSNAICNLAKIKEVEKNLISQGLVSEKEAFLLKIRRIIAVTSLRKIKGMGRFSTFLQKKIDYN
ncbi:glycosyltransferase family 2 protein [Leeuwenhoekiella sp. A2]|uniref:glycosyltransferase family 2 protein n=1 Tax=Leeuwenhoekiella sp. A2 TaxID=3141460 RepID=UPI003A7FB413